MRRLAVVTAFVTQLGACGGSSSETPPPLEPDPARLRARPLERAEPAAAGAPRTEATSEPSSAEPIPALPPYGRRPPARGGAASTQPESPARPEGSGGAAPEPR